MDEQTVRGQEEEKNLYLRDSTRLYKMNGK